MLSGPEKALLAVLILVLMTGMGATLTPRQFLDIRKRPRGPIIGLLSQYGWMPLVAFGLARALELPDAVALGLVIVGATPGGTTSNLFTYYAGADLALSILMTTLSTVVAVVAMPLVLLVYATPFTGSDLSVPYGSVVTTLALMLLPVSLGMWIRSRSESAAARVERAGSLAGMGVLVMLVISGIVRNGHLFVRTSLSMYTAAIGLGVIGMGLGYLVARAAGLKEGSRRSVAFETGIQNSPLALAIIVASFPEEDQLAIMWLPLLYALFVLISASAVTVLLRVLDGRRAA